MDEGNFRKKEEMLRGRKRMKQQRDGRLKEVVKGRREIMIK
jgi:hypothetical protein